MTKLSYSCYTILKISTHTLTWSVTDLINTNKIQLNDFNSHDHVERDFFLCRFFLGFCHFNSHAHVERDKIDYFVKNSFIISTHTLTWSVTNKPQPYLQILTNFNSHAHVERDVLPILLFTVSELFQLTRSRGA